MRAWVLHDIGDIRLETSEEPLLAAHEVLLEVKAAGICGSDIPRIFETGAHSFPLIPGHEFSGIVTKTGAGVNNEWQGQRVGVFPMIPCKICVFCRKKQYEMCRNYSYLGSRRNGGFAEYVAVPEDNLIKLPESVTFEEAAMLEPMAVAVHAMRRIAPAASDTIVVCGLGTIGLLLLMFLLEMQSKAFGKHGRILVIGNKEMQMQTILKMGLSKECYCDGSKQDAGKWLMEQTKGRGADVFFECVGRNETFAQAVTHTAPTGKIMLVGNPYTDMTLEKSVYWKILRNQLVVTGTWNSSFAHEPEDDWHYVLELLLQKRIAPAELISHRVSLDKLEQGFQMMRNKTEDYVKVMGVV